MQSENHQPISPVVSNDSHLPNYHHSDRRIYEKRKMHKYVVICLGVFFIFVATFPLAYLRVSRSEKYHGGPFKTQSY